MPVVLNPTMVERTRLLSFLKVLNIKINGKKEPERREELPTGIVTTILEQRRVPLFVRTITRSEFHSISLTSVLSDTKSQISNKVRRKKIEKFAKGPSFTSPQRLRSKAVYPSLTRHSPPPAWSACSSL
jgi:hypothetical protein